MQALATPHSDQPRVVIANTTKGKGASFMENGVEWHHKVPSDAQYEIALKELDQ
jgi:transketolase